MADLAWWLRWIGPTVGFLGAFSLAWAQQAPSKETGMIDDASGEVMASVFLKHPFLWKAGLALLIIGFIVQALGSFYS